MLSLFISLLLHVRLPLAVGDEICEFLGAWITRFAGPGYYNSQIRKRKKITTKVPRTDQANSRPQQQIGNEATEEDLEVVETAIQAMETWNKDLTWFIFQQERARVASKSASGVAVPEALNRSLPSHRLHETLNKRLIKGNKKLKFAEVVF